MARAETDSHQPNLSLAAYQSDACATNQISGEVARDQLRFGFFGEVGGILALVKKSYRELAPADHRAINEELGDALWYLTNVAVIYGVSLSQVGQRAMVALNARMGFKMSSEGNLCFEKFDAVLTLHDEHVAEDQRPALLRGLASRTGQLLGEGHGAGQSPELFSTTPLHLLGELFADLAMVAGTFKQAFADVAANNTHKIKSRWPGESPAYLPLFDDGRSILEQFPRQFSMHFIEVQPDGGNPYVIQRMNGVNVGDRLTDNRSIKDGYRFHDVFHLAYLTYLGWSPVIRALLKLKRKSDRLLDENEDGARAIIIEEGIATWIFNHAESRGFFADVKPGRLDYGMLKQVLDMVSGYEVHACPLWQWEKAILEGFRIFRALADSPHGCGEVRVDLNVRTMEFVAGDPPETPLKKKARQVPVGALPPTPAV